ncbi:hypothetical protein FRC08_010717 [Ceratobasidium sp. 394]|nr:hypothetical protein FRC08_010717 [Ceratobasidium sp. 394]
MSGKYYLLERRRIPQRLIYIEDPKAFDEEDTWAWAKMLHSPESTGRLAFQFRQPRPGVIEEDTRTVISPASHLQFAPESLAYMRRCIMEQGLDLDRWNGLPVMSGEVVQVLSEEGLLWATKAAGDQEVLKDLVAYLSAYEIFGPYQATHADWERSMNECMYVRKELPDCKAGPKHLVATEDEHGYQLPRQFFDSSSPDYRLWDLGSLLGWIDGDTFLHRSGTLAAGPYGWKWAVFILLLLYVGGLNVRVGNGPTYDGLTAEWQSNDTTAVLSVAQRLLNCLLASAKTLNMSKPEREAAGLEMELEEQDQPSWAVEEIGMTAFPAPRDEWTRRGLPVTREPEPEVSQRRRGAASSSSGTSRCVSNKRARAHKAAEDSHDESMSDSDEEQPQRKVSKYSKSTPSVGDLEDAPAPRRSGKAQSNPDVCRNLTRVALTGRIHKTVSFEPDSE